MRRFESFKYESSDGSVVEFGESTRIFPNMNALRDYSYSYTLTGETVTEFKQNIHAESVDVSIYGSSREELMSRRNRIYSVFDADISRTKPGKLWINDSYIFCYIIKSVNTHYLSENVMKTSWEFLLLGSWMIERKYSVSAATEENGQTGFPFTWSHRWGKGNTDTLINLDHFKDSDIMLVAYGYAEELNVMIGENTYKVDHEIPTGGYMVIDTRKTADKEKRIYVRYPDGHTVNVFNDRSTEFNALAKIKSGENIIQYSKQYGIDITVFIERSEPVWN